MATTADGRDISRVTLLDTQFSVPSLIERVQTAQVELAPGLRAGTHTHPCHVIGQVAMGEIDFEIEGQPPQRLRAGDAFYEPAHVRINRFDNASDTEPAVFIANYLLAPGEDRLIEFPAA